MSSGIKAETYPLKHPALGSHRGGPKHDQNLVPLELRSVRGLNSDMPRPGAGGRFAPPGFGGSGACSSEDLRNGVPDVVLNRTPPTNQRVLEHDQNKMS